MKITFLNHFSSTPLPFSTPQTTQSEKYIEKFFTFFTKKHCFYSLSFFILKLVNNKNFQNKGESMNKKQIFSIIVFIFFGLHIHAQYLVLEVSQKGKDPRIIEETGQAEKEIKILDISSGKIIKSLIGYTSNASKKGKYIAIQSKPNQIDIYDRDSGFKLTRSFYDCLSITFSPNEKLAILYLPENRAQILDISQNWKNIKNFTLVDPYFIGNPFSSRENYFALGKKDSSLQILDPHDNFKIIKELPKTEREFRRLEVTRELIAPEEQIQEMQQVRELYYIGALFSQNERYLAATTEYFDIQRIYLYNTKTWKKMREFPGRPMEFKKDLFLVEFGSGTLDLGINIYDMSQQWKKIKELSGFQPSFSEDAKFIALQKERGQKYLTRVLDRENKWKEVKTFDLTQYKQFDHQRDPFKFYKRYHKFFKEQFFIQTATNKIEIYNISETPWKKLKDIIMDTEIENFLILPQNEDIDTSERVQFFQTKDIPIKKFEIKQRGKPKEPIIIPKLLIREK